MKYVKKIISLLLICIILVSSIGIQGVVHKCLRKSHANEVKFFANQSNETCCHKSVKRCCHSHRSHTEYKKTECCIDNTFYFKLNPNTLLNGYKKIVLNVLEFTAVELYIPKVIFSNQYKQFAIFHFARENLAENKLLLAFISQFLK